MTSRFAASSLLGQVSRVLFVHAHPDDETLSTGCVIAALTSDGVECDVVTATRGERGEVVAGPLSYLEGTPELRAYREGELAGALEALDVARHGFLGVAPALAPGAQPRHYSDSGMEWIRPGLAGPASDAAPESFSRAERADELADLVAWLQDRRPDLVVSYDAGGGYGHPDHVRAHEVARAAARAVDLPFAEVRHDPGDGVEWFELPDTLPTVQAALRCHATQLTVHGVEVVHSGGQREPIVTSIGLAKA